MEQTKNKNFIIAIIAIIAVAVMVAIWIKTESEDIKVINPNEFSEAKLMVPTEEMSLENTEEMIEVTEVINDNDGSGVNDDLESGEEVLVA